jgi:hypothetical protein
MLSLAAFKHAGREPHIANANLFTRNPEVEHKVDLFHD